MFVIPEAKNPEGHRGVIQADILWILRFAQNDFRLKVTTRVFNLY